MSARSPASARVTRRFDASPERVFDSWLDPAQVRVWLASAAGNPAMGELVRVDIDARVGGSFCFVYQRSGAQWSQTGEYLEIDRPRRLVFTWAMALPDVERVIVDIVPAGTGCELTLTHEMDPAWTGDPSPAGSAWAVVLAAIAETLAAGGTQP